MYKHHEDSIVKLINYFEPDASVLAVILGGSVAKGLERPDSDLDAMVVVTDGRHEQLAKEDRLVECIFGHCTYEGGYFDVKYCTMDYLRAVAQRGSEPARNAYLKARCLFARDPEIEYLVPRIGEFQASERDEKMMSFYSALMLSANYFFAHIEGNNYLRLRTLSEIVLYGYRMLLQDAGVLFSCHKSLEMQIAALKRKPDGIADMANRLMTEQTAEAKDAFVSAILDFVDFKRPEDFAEVLTRFTQDNELWWYQMRPVIAEW